jgi:hypothetical protein
MPGAENPTAARLGVLDAAGGVAWWRGEMETADRYYAEQVELARRIGEPHALAHALSNLGHTRLFRPDPAEGAAVRAEAARLFAETGDARGVVRLGWMEANLLMTTDPVGATRQLEEVLARSVELGDIFYVAMASGSLSWSLTELGDYDGAFEHGLRSFQLAFDGRDVGAATVAIRELEVHLHLLGYRREAAMLEGAFQALSNRYGINTPPALLQHIQRLWPGRTALRDELGEGVYEALRKDGTAMTLEDVASLIDDIRQQRWPAPSCPTT